MFQILEARIKQLAADNGVVSAEADHSISNQPSSTDLSTPDTLGHLARVQSLMTYLLIMLFNGDIHLRHVAEQYIPVLEAWIRQMVENARTALLPGSLIDTIGGDALWHTWIIAESLRRTFLVGRSIVSLYEMLKAGEPVSMACKGGMVFTIRKGAWEATSAAEWEGLAAEVYLGLMQVGDARTWVKRGRVARSQVDLFAATFLRGTFGDNWTAVDGYYSICSNR